MNKRIVILEKTNIGGYSAYLPELPGCISTADSLLEIKRSIKNSVEFHIEGMQKENLQIPESFQGEYELAYKMDVASLFDWFSGVLTKSGISNIFSFGIIESSNKFLSIKAELTSFSNGIIYKNY